MYIHIYIKEKVGKVSKPDSVQSQIEYKTSREKKTVQNKTLSKTSTAIARCTTIYHTGGHGLV